VLQAPKSRKINNTTMPTLENNPSGKSNDIVVFMIRREATCAECERDLSDGNLLRMEGGTPLCIDCADLGHLEYLGAGNTALTRRATKHSPLRAVVVRWSRTRNRYERQGILVTPDAIQRAETECLADEDKRARQRERAVLRRAGEDSEFVAAVTERLWKNFPGCPAEEARRIAEWTCRRGSDSVGRSAAAKELDAEALRLAVIAHIRHEHTRYDELLMKYGDRPAARAHVRGDIEKVIAVGNKVDV
jgi:hypothetical protein